MKKDIESILVINKYLIKAKNDNEKSQIIRSYLTSKVNSTLRSKVNSNRSNIVTKIFNIPLTLLSI